MNRAQQIESLLQTSLEPLRLEVVDDSAKHHGHAGAAPGGQTHYTVIIASSRFEGLSRLARHRLVFDALGTQFSEGLHALAIDAYAPGER